MSNYHLFIFLKICCVSQGNEEINYCTFFGNNSFTVEFQTDKSYPSPKNL